MPRRSAVAAAVRRPQPGPNRSRTSPRPRPPVRSPQQRPPARGASSRRPTCPSVPVVRVIMSSQAPLLTSALFRARASARYPVGCAKRSAEEPTFLSRCPVTFRPTGIRFLSILSRQGVKPSSRSADRTPETACPDLDGVSPFHTHEIRPGWVLSRPRDGGALPAASESPAGTRRFTAASPQPQQCVPSKGAQRNEASSRVHVCSPVRSSPCLWTPDGAGSLGLLPGAPHPTVTSDARPGEDARSSTHPRSPSQRHRSAPPIC